MSVTEIKFRFSGKKNLLPTGRSGFFKELQELYTTAGLSGTVPVKILGRLRMRVDRPGRGWHVHAPGNHGVPISWVESPDNALRMITGIDGVPPIELCERFKRALEGTNGVLHDHLKEEALATNQTPADDPADPVLAKILGGQADTETAPVSTEEGPQSPSPAELGEEQSAYSVFINDPERIELFLMEIVKEVNPRREFGTSVAVEMLRDHFGFPSDATRAKNRSGWNKPYNALYNLSRSGVLEKLTYGYRIPKETFERLRGSEKPIEPPAQENKAPIVPALPKASSITAEIELLTWHAQNYEKAEARKTVIHREIGEIVTQIQPLEQRKQELEEELASMAGTLEDSTGKEAAEQLAAIRKLLEIE